MLENHCSAKVKRVPMLLKQRLGRDFGSSYDRLAQIEVVLMTTVGVTEYLIGLAAAHPHPSAHQNADVLASGRI